MHAHQHSIAPRGGPVTVGVPAPASLADKTLGEAALTWASLGWAVFPIVPRGKTPYATGEFCGRTDDHSCGFHCATGNQETLAAWWTGHPDSNIGLSAPDAFIVDEDRIGALHEAGISLPRCPWAVTGRTGGGRHFFLRAPKDWDGLAGDNVKVTYKVAGVEVKGFDKGYVVAAPSVHATGARYELKAGGYVPEAPDTVIRQLVDVTGSVPLTTTLITITGGGYDLPASVGEGGRYEAIRSYVAHLYNRGLSPDEMWPLVQDLLAPTFVPRLPIHELRERFRRATEGLEKRLGERRAITGQGAPAVAPLSLDDAPLTEFDSRPIEWLWPSWLPRGVVTLMDGNPGVSKSTLVADLVARITTGTEWPDGTPAGHGPARVLWVTTEDDPGRVLRPRIEAAGGDASLVRFVTSEVVFPQAATAFQELLVQRATEPLGLELAILDPLFSHIDAKVKSIADADMRQGVMNPLNRAAEAADIAVLVVRHFNKDTAASALNRGAGSLGGIVGAARALWSVALDPEDESGDTKAIGVSKLNYARAHPPLRYRVVDRIPPGWITGTVSGIEWLGEAPVSMTQLMTENSGVGDAVNTLLELLQDGPVGASHVKAQMRSRGFGVDATKSAKARLRVASTKTGMDGGWVWTLPEEVATEGVASEEVAATPSTPSATSSADSRGRARTDARREGPVTHPFHSFEEVEEVASAAPPARAAAPARVREAEAPALHVVRDDPSDTITCHFYQEHQTRHVQVDGRWICPICDPDPPTEAGA